MLLKADVLCLGIEICLGSYQGIQQMEIWKPVKFWTVFAADTDLVTILPGTSDHLLQVGFLNFIVT